MNPGDTIEARFERMDQERTTQMMMKRECTELTIPRLLPPQAFHPGDDLPVPLNATPAFGIKSFASKMTSHVTPIDGSSMFQISLPDEGSAADMSPEAIAKRNSIRETLENHFIRGEQTLMEDLRNSNLRKEMGGICLALSVIGDILVIQHDNMRFSTVRLDNYVVARLSDGTPYHIIYREWYAPESLPAAYLGGVPPSPLMQKEAVYTEYRRATPTEAPEAQDDEGTWTIKKEFRKKPISTDGSTEIRNVYPLAVGLVSGENYGRSPIEDIIGDIRTLMALTKGLIEATAGNSEWWLGVNPQGITQIADIEERPVGSWVPARKDDVFTISAELANDIIVLSQAVEKAEQKILKCLLYNPSYAGNRDRVTATEWYSVTELLQEGMAEMLTGVSSDIYLPIARRTLALRAAKNQTLSDILKLVKEKTLTIKIRAGLEILSREVTGSRLAKVVDTVSRYPAIAAEPDRIRWEQVVTDMFQSQGFDGQKYVTTDAERVSNRQQQLAEQTAASAAADVAKQAAAGQPA